MKRLIKFIVITVVVVVALVGILAVAVPLLVDPNDYREQIAPCTALPTTRPSICWNIQSCEAFGFS